MEPTYRIFAGLGEDALRALSQGADDPWVRGFALQIRAQIEENEGRREEQRALTRAAHEMLTGTGDRFALGLVGHALGELEDSAGNYDAAARAYDEAIALATELGNDDDLPQFLGRRAALEARRGDLAAARAVLARAQPPGRRPFRSAGAVATTLAQIELMAGDLDAARAHLDTVDREFAAARMDEVGVPQRRAFQALMWAAVELASGDLAPARARTVEAVAAAVAAEDGPVTALVAEVAAALALAEDDPEAAATLLGIAAAQRGTLDHGSPDVRATLDGVRTALGRDAAEERMRAGRELPRADGVARLAAFAGTATGRRRTGEQPAPASRP